MSVATEVARIKDALCVCGKPRHRGMCVERWALRRSGEGAPPRPKLQHSRPGTPKRRFYERALAGWRRIEIATYADGARPRTEIVWLNPKCVAALGDGPLYDHKPKEAA